MTYHYYINTGRFVGGSGDSAIKTFGYSGSGQVIKCNIKNTVS